VNTSPATLATKELAVASLQRNVSQFLLSQGNFDQKQHDRLPPPTLLSTVSPIEDTTEVIEAESQAVLYTLKEHDL
jgi:hypothetical protein